ncbi:hypothetical protein [Actinosynnema sp. ALI-1.44]|uniref:hypothetical protein n=1 Tax=Actinosynnema sp. ALI-1.44 TaxID=1933779 RepID=UPI00192D0A86|nr:hypothetical protein [Actinosynnema sp. ALI-1.44]
MLVDLSVVVDEIHAFAGDDCGWHLLAVLSDCPEWAGRPLQRIGFSVTVGNPPALQRWLQGSVHARERKIVASEPTTGQPPDITVDHVGSVDNAAKGDLPAAPGREAAGVRGQQAARRTSWARR